MIKSSTIKARPVEFKLLSLPMYFVSEAERLYREISD